VRPTPAEVIAGVRRILRDVVAPDVSSDYALSRLRAVLAVLAEVDWNDAPLRVLRDNHDLRTLIERCDAWVADDPDRADAFPDHPLIVLTGRANGSPGLGGEVPSFEDANSLNGEYRLLLVRTVPSLAEWLRHKPTDASAEALSRDVIHHLSTAPGARSSKT
jgi:hypothetical protein